jgi:hypothetical protein
MPTRGSYDFEINADDALVDNAANLEKLRKLFRDGDIVDGDFGPGNPGDFDYGSWHILCHLAAGTGVLETPAGRAWCAITHVPANDTYRATITHRRNGAAATVPLANGDGAALADGARCVGFIEGSSAGHIFARGASDSPRAFNGWPRQRFDKDASSDDTGGTVWELWSATRDIRRSSAIGSSVVKAYLTLLSRLGGRFVAAVARGRRVHNHPAQLVALVEAGLLTMAEATWDVMPELIDRTAQERLQEARPADSLAAAESLPFAPDGQHYFMFQRRIGDWSTAANVRADFANRRAYI